MQLIVSSLVNFAERVANTESVFQNTQRSDNIGC